MEVSHAAYEDGVDEVLDLTDDVFYMKKMLCHTFDDWYTTTSRLQWGIAADT